jgi:hypothetical protein
MWRLPALPTTWAADRRRCASGHVGRLGQSNPSASMAGWLGPLAKFGGCLRCSHRLAQAIMPPFMTMHLSAVTDRATLAAGDLCHRFQGAMPQYFRSGPDAPTRADFLPVAGGY